MSISFTCPICGHPYEASPDRVGEKNPCSGCGKLLTIPQADSRFTGPAPEVRTTIWGVLLGAGIVLLMVAMCFPPIQMAREAARRSSCIGNLNFISLAMHNHHDFHQTLPLASTRPRSGMPGGIGSNHPAGYGWCVALLPFLEEDPLYQQLSQASGQFQTAAFDPRSQPELSCTPIHIFRCYSDAHPEYVDVSASEYREYTLPHGKKVPPGRTSYVALTASHFTNATGLGLLAGAAPNSPFEGNGVVVFPTVHAQLHQGLTFRDITDGTSKTLMLAETREPAYAAWIDGQATWAIGAWQGGSAIPTETGAADGMLGWPDADQTSRGSLYDRTAGNSQDVYLSAARYGAGHDRRWGPSSNHSGGAINHAFADGHVQSILPTIDRNLYLRLISRSGGEEARFD